MDLYSHIYEEADQEVARMFDKLIKVCCRGDANLTVASVPSILTGDATPGTTTVTEVPVIQNANFSIVKKA